MVKSDGTPVCWGRSTEGQLVPPAGLGGVKQIAAGGGHTCVIRQADSKPICWGLNNFGQKNAPNVAVKLVAAGGAHNCAIKLDNTLTCWGSNLGFGGTTANQAVPPSGTFKQLTTSENHNCAVRISNNMVVCWGDNFYGQSAVPGDLGAVSAISAGAYHTCAIKLSDGHVVCWGDNSNSASTPPPSLGTALTVSTGEVHACAEKSNGTVVCWGADSFGQSDEPADLGTFSQLSVGYFHNCVVETAGPVFCWGSNVFEQSGVVPVITSESPTVVRGAGPFSHTFSAAATSGLAVRFSVTSGALPPGITLNATSGHLAGTPTADGVYTATVSASNDIFRPGTQTFTITIDRVAPDAPEVLDTKPASPSNTVTPRITGTAEAGSTVTVFDTADCSGLPVGTGSANAFASAGISVGATSGGTTTFRARATDAAGNVSACSASSVDFVNDVTPPDAPTITATDPPSPSETISPRVLGTAPDETTVSVYASADCSGQPLATGAAKDFASPGLTVTVPAGALTHLRATATDIAGNSSSCSDDFSYLHLQPGPTGPTGGVKPLATAAATGLKASRCLRARGGLLFNANVEDRFKVTFARQTSPRLARPKSCPRVAPKISKKAKFRTARTRTTPKLAVGPQRLDLETQMRRLPAGLYRITVDAVVKRAARSHPAEIYVWKLR